MPVSANSLSPDTAQRLNLEARISGLQGKLKESEERARHWCRERDQLEDRFNALAAIRQEVEPGPAILQEDLPEAEAICIANWSDWHVAEKVDKSKVSGKNSYSPEIARIRSRKCAESTRRLFKHVRNGYKVDTLVLLLGGDFITGYLHEELAQTNAMPPVEETSFAKTLLIDGLTHLVEEKSIKKLRVICSRGNHGRTTRKMQYKNDYETSYESWLYWDLQEKFADGKRVEFYIPRGDVAVTKLFGNFKLRTYHGHQIKYNDGVGGLTIPLNKWQSKQQQIEPADFNLHGHYHTYGHPNQVTIQNGALKGFDEYAASHGFPYQEPLQTFALVDVKRRIVAQHLPVFCT